MPTRKKYSKEFKLDAVSLITEQHYTRAEAARSLDLHANMLSRWAKEVQRHDGPAFRGNAKLTEEQEENRKLKAQVTRLEREKDIFKKRRYSLQSKRKEVFLYHQHKNTYSLSLQWQVLGANRSGYGHYQANVANKSVDPVHQEMVEWGKDIAEHSRSSDDSCRMMKALTLQGYPVNRDKARKLIGEAGGQVRHRQTFKVTTNSDHKHSVFHNLVHRQFAVPQPTRSTPLM